MSKLSLSILALTCVLFAAAPAQAAGNAKAGATKAEACMECHGEDGKGDEDNPSIAGMSADKFTKAMQEYKAGTRTKSKQMTKAAQKLSAEDIADLAAHYATLKP